MTFSYTARGMEAMDSSAQRVSSRTSSLLNKFLVSLMFIVLLLSVCLVCVIFLLSIYRTTAIVHGVQHRAECAEFVRASPLQGTQGIVAIWQFSDSEIAMVYSRCFGFLFFGDVCVGFIYFLNYLSHPYFVCGRILPVARSAGRVSSDKPEFSKIDSLCNCSLEARLVRVS